MAMSAVVSRLPRVTDAEGSPVDHAHLARYTMGNRPLELEVLNLFADQAPEYLAQLRVARDEKAWRDAAHTLKGSARAVGAFRVGDLAMRAEALSGSPDPVARAQVIESLEAALEEARAYIAGLEGAV
ncbi:MAG: Hpt domain-containing protein [Hyphomicrobiaceae bacterium]